MELKIRDISKKYQKEYAVSHFSATLTPGTLIGLVGPNGAGKSTFLKMLATLIRPTSGEVLLDHESIIRHPEKMRRVLGYLPQQAAVFPDLTAMEFLCYMAAMKQIPKKQAEKQIREFLDRFHLASDAGKRLSDYSGGMKQRVGLACALLGNPRILIVDEPTAGLDPGERITVRNVLSEYAREHIVILSTHVISDIEAAASRLMIMKKGILLFDGAPGELVEQASGHVWEYTRSSSENIADLSGISSMIQQKDSIKIRQVSAEMPRSTARPAEPTLEDACLYKLEVSL